MKERVRERLIALAPKVGYPIFYLFCFVVFATWTFPWDKVKDRIVLSFDEGQRTAGSHRRLTIDEMSSSWVTGVKLEGVHLTDSDPAEPQKPPSDMKIDALTTRVALLPLLVGNRDVSFSADAFGGSVNGSFKQHGKDESLEVNLENLDVGQVAPITDILGVPMEGTLEGALKLDLPEGKTNKANGTLSLDVHGMAMGDGKAKVKGTLAIPRLVVGDLTLSAESKDGNLKIAKLAASGKDVDLAGDGRVLLRESTAESSVDLNVRFRINDAYRGKNDTTKSLFGEPGSSVPGIIDLDPKSKSAKRADGFYSWHGRGPLAKIDWSPAAGGGPPVGLPHARP